MKITAIVIITATLASPVMGQMGYHVLALDSIRLYSGDSITGTIDNQNEGEIVILDKTDTSRIYDYKNGQITTAMEFPLTS